MEAEHTSVEGIAHVFLEGDRILTAFEINTERNNSHLQREECKYDIPVWKNGLKIWLLQNKKVCEKEA